MKYILIYGFKSIDPKKRLEFNRKLYGYNDHSNFGSYSYFRDGIIDLKTSKRLAKGVVLLGKIPKELVKHLKQYKASYNLYKVIA